MIGRPRFRSECQQFLPPLDRHQPARRVLMRGRAENQPRPVGPSRKAQSAAVERDSPDPRARRFERHARAAIAGALDPRQIARIEDDPRDQFDGGLGRRRDDQPSRVGLDAAVLHEMAEQCRAKRRMVGADHAGACRLRAARRRQRAHTSCGNSRASASPGANGRGRPSLVKCQSDRLTCLAQREIRIRPERW